MEFSYDYTLLTVMFGTGLLGIICGMISSVNVLREQSLLGDVISHAALPGVIVAYILFQTKDLSVLICGALISAFLGLALIRFISNGLNKKQDEAFAIIISLSFGISILLISLVQRQNYSVAGLETFIFGQASTMVFRDVVMIFCLFLVIIVGFTLLRKEIMTMIFDPVFFRCLGFNNRLVEFMLMVFEIMTIVIGIRTVGVILLVSMLIAPMAAARHWSNNFYFLMMLSSIVGMVCGVFASLISSSFHAMPTGPIMIILLSIIVFLSLFLSPQKGLIKKWLIKQRGNRLLKQDFILKNLYEMSMKHGGPYHPHTMAALESLATAQFFKLSKKDMYFLRSLGKIESIFDNKWKLTQKGLAHLEENNA